MTINWDTFKLRLLNFCSEAKPRELVKHVDARTLYAVINGGDCFRGGISGYLMFKDLVEMIPKLKHSDDKILASLIIVTLAKGARFKSLCDLALKLEDPNGSGIGRDR